MYTFFKELEELARLGNDYKSIKDLTIDLAKSGGYRREAVTLKNGKTVLRTKYGEIKDGKIIPTWDDVLVAKWLHNYRSLFISKLAPHPELSDFYIEIIQRTFTITFNALQLDKLKSDSNVNTIVYMCLANRIGDALIKKGSVTRMESYNESRSYYNKNSRERINLKYAINNMAISLDKITENGYQIEKPSDINHTLITLQKAVEGIPYGRRLLDALLYSGDKVNTKSISKYINLTDGEKNRTTLKYLKNAWNIIQSNLIDCLIINGIDDIDVYDWDKKVSFKF